MFSSSILPLAYLSALLTTTVAYRPEPISGFNVQWSEDFSGSSLDTSVWNRVTGTNVNQEQEQYTATGNNCQITYSQTLLITPENNGGQWTSCRVETVPAFTTTAGKIMIVQSRLRLGTPGSQLQGVWPAFWSLGESIRSGTQ